MALGFPHEIRKVQACPQPVRRYFLGASQKRALQRSPYSEMGGFEFQHLRMWMQKLAGAWLNSRHQGPKHHLSCHQNKARSVLESSHCWTVIGVEGVHTQTCLQITCIYIYMYMYIWIYAIKCDYMWLNVIICVYYIYTHILLPFLPTSSVLSCNLVS